MRPSLLSQDPQPLCLAIRLLACCLWSGGATRPPARSPPPCLGIRVPMETDVFKRWCYQCRWVVGSTTSASLYCTSSCFQFDRLPSLF